MVGQTAFNVQTQKYDVQVQLLRAEYVRVWLMFNYVWWVFIKSNDVLTQLHSIFKAKNRVFKLDYQ